MHETNFLTRQLKSVIVTCNSSGCKNCTTRWSSDRSKTCSSLRILRRFSSIVAILLVLGSAIAKCVLKWSECETHWLTSQQIYRTRMLNLSISITRRSLFVTVIENSSFAYLGNPSFHHYKKIHLYSFLVYITYSVYITHKDIIEMHKPTSTM